LAGHAVPTMFALAAVAALVLVGQRTGWRMSKFSELMGNTVAEKDDWCAEHSVPDSQCVECQKGCMARGKEFGWCKLHGVSECPLEHPDVAQLSPPPTITQEDRDRAQRALSFAPRVENNSRCKLNQRRIQFSSAEAVTRLGIEVRPVSRTAVAETVTANGELNFDPTQVARLSSRAPGTLWRVEKQVGDKVKKGEVLALVDAADVGKAKAEFQQALVNLDLKTQTLAKLKELAGLTASEQSVEEARAAVAEAEVRLLAARQTLVNLGLYLRVEDYKKLAPADVARQMQFLGLPADLAREVARQTSSSNLLPVRAPLDGEVIVREGVARETVDPRKMLFVVADTRQMWLTLQVRLEDVERVKPGQSVRFRHEGHSEFDIGTVAWVSPAVDEDKKTRTVAVRVELPNPDGRHRAGEFGTAQIVLREEPKAIVVPSTAVHWEGDCNVVFVRDKDFDQSKYKVFHVRKVRPGAKDVTSEGRVTEIIAGVLPGELVATTGSGTLRSELLKNNLGAG
jgi:cobalt-zinc-cadmium efflux system membrane fusion protein